MGDWFPKETLGMLPAKAAARWGKRDALVFKGRRWSWIEFDREVDRAAKALLAIGVQPQEKVALWMTNRPEWLFLMYGILKVGAVLVPLNTRYRTDDLAYAVAQSNTGTLITLDVSGPVRYLDLVEAVLPDTAGSDPLNLRLEGFPDLRRVVFDGEQKLPGTLSWQEVLSAADGISDQTLAERAAAVDPDGLALIGYTSGTTGDPKGVMHSHICIRLMTERVALLGCTFRDAHLNYMPMFHIYGLSEVALTSILSGAKQVLMDVFDSAVALRLVEQEKITFLHGFDTHWKDLLDTQAAQPADISSVRLGTFPSGVDASIPICKRAQEVFCPTLSGFGMTETWAYICTSYVNSTPEQQINASGMPMPGEEAKVVHVETGEEQPPNVPGELLIRGYMNTKGYYRKPEATADTIQPDGWLHTGDMAVLRDDGHLVFMGRYKDMLKVGGENVSPAEVEAKLMELPGVQEISVVAYPDPRLMEVPVAFVVRAKGSQLTEEDVLAYCRGKIASFKIPKRAIFVDQFPMTSSGKVQKIKLRALALETLGDPGK